MVEAQVRECTPQNIDELALAILKSVHGGDLPAVSQRIHSTVKDYLANRFGPTLFQAERKDVWLSDEVEQLILDLFKHCTEVKK